MSNSHHLDKFVIRLPDGLRPAIHAQAKANLRSMNNEIIHSFKRSQELEILYENQLKLNKILVQCIQKLQNPEIIVETFNATLSEEGE